MTRSAEHHRLALMSDHPLLPVRHLFSIAGSQLVDTPDMVDVGVLSGAAQFTLLCQHALDQFGVPVMRFRWSVFEDCSCFMLEGIVAPGRSQRCFSLSLNGRSDEPSLPIVVTKSGYHLIDADLVFHR